MSETKKCQNCHNNFLIEDDDFAFYKKMDVPPPTWCPECRFQRRIVFRNERKLFKAKSALSGKTIFTLLPPEGGFTIYRDDEWHSDVWSPLTYGQDVDFAKPFLQQVSELNKKVPKYHQSAIVMINSEYSANASYLKNCYLMFNSNHTGDCAYGNGVDYCRDCYDNSHIQECERCYESFWLTKCFEAHFSSRCEDCNNVWFSKDCRGCSDCFGCVNLRRKKYCTFNKQYTKEEYEKKLKEMGLSGWGNFSKAGVQAKEFWLKFPNKFLQGVQNTNVSGEYITHSKNVLHSYLVREGEDIKYSHYLQVPEGKDCYDTSIFGASSNHLYEASICGWTGGNLKFCFECWNETYNMEYCMFCQTSSYLFGCVNMKKSQYCILNKQYSKGEYEALVQKIKKHMDDMPYVDKKGRVYKYGEFFPAELSPFAYNQTIASEHFPLTKEDAIAQGFRWQDPNPTEYQTTMDASAIPDDINDVQDGILKEIIKCETCGRAYRLIPPELKFLRQVGISAPRTCVDCRHATRISQRNRGIFYQRKCTCVGQKSENGIYQNTAVHFHGNEHCLNEFETSYAPDRPEIVYCEQCYNQEVV